MCRLLQLAVLPCGTELSELPHCCVLGWQLGKCVRSIQPFQALTLRPRGETSTTQPCAQTYNLGLFSCLGLREVPVCSGIIWSPFP